MNLHAVVYLTDC